VCTYVYIHTSRRHKCTHMYICVHTYIKKTQMYTYVHMCTYIHQEDTNVHICTYVYIHTYMHQEDTYVHTSRICFALTTNTGNRVQLIGNWNFSNYTFSLDEKSLIKISINFLLLISMQASMWYDLKREMRFVKLFHSCPIVCAQFMSASLH
jgi:hypothetical protein